MDAEKELRVAVNEAPSVAIYHAQLGSILGLQGKWNDALESFQKAVRIGAGEPLISGAKRPPCNGRWA